MNSKIRPIPDQIAQLAADIALIETRIQDLERILSTVATTLNLDINKN